MERPATVRLAALWIALLISLQGHQTKIKFKQTFYFCSCVLQKFIIHEYAPESSKESLIYLQHCSTNCSFCWTNIPIQKRNEHKTEDNPLYAGRRPPGPQRGDPRPRAPPPPVIFIPDMDAMRRGRERGLRAARERAMAREREKELREARERAREEREQETREEQGQNAEEEEPRAEEDINRQDGRQMKSGGKYNKGGIKKKGTGELGSGHGKNKASLRRRQLVTELKDKIGHRHQERHGKQGPQPCTSRAAEEDIYAKIDETKMMDVIPKQQDQARNPEESSTRKKQNLGDSMRMRSKKNPGKVNALKSMFERQNDQDEESQEKQGSGTKEMGFNPKQEDKKKRADVAAVWV